MGSDPAYPAKHAEASEQEARNKVVERAAHGNEQEELVPRDVLPLDLRPVLVERVDKRAAHESRGPDHAGWPDEERPRETGKDLGEVVE